MRVKTHSIYSLGGKLRESRFPHGSIIAALLMSFALVFVLVLTATGTTPSVEYNRAVIATFIINLGLGIAFLGREIVRRPFSLMQIHWVFFLTFFVIAPVSQFAHGYYPWGYTLSADDYIACNLFVLLWGVLFGVASCLRSDSDDKESNNKLASLYDSLPKVSNLASIVLLLISAIATVLVIRLVGFEDLFSRFTYDIELDKTLGLLFDKGIRPIPVFAFVFLLVRYKQSGKGLILLLCGAFLLLISNFPTGMARYNAAAIYGGLSLLVFPQLMERRGLFPTVFLLLLLVVFPASNVYRFNELDFSLMISQMMSLLSNFSSGFLSGDYDAYSMLIRAFHYVRAEGVSNGWQLLTVILFFVPRSLWPAKALGSGATIALSQGQLYTNLSCPLPAEGMINFGVMGLVVFALVFGVVCRRCDSWFYCSNNPARIFYCFACFLFFFILRGDLLSSWAYTFGYAIVFLAIFFLTRFISSHSIVQS